MPSRCRRIFRKISNITLFKYFILNKGAVKFIAIHSNSKKCCKSFSLNFVYKIKLHSYKLTLSNFKILIFKNSLSFKYVVHSFLSKENLDPWVPYRFS